MKTTVIIQARTGSTRLPGKVLMKLYDQPMLAHVIDRCKAIQSVDHVMVATTTDISDDAIVKLASRMNIDVYRGSETNVLSRYYEAAQSTQSDVIVRVTSDCPLLDPQISNKVVQAFKADETLDYCSNTLQRSFPQGLDTEVFTFHALESAYRQAKEAFEQEHVTPYIYQHEKMFKLSQYVSPQNFSHYRWTVDTLEDFKLVEAIYSKLYRPGIIFPWSDVLELMNEQPELARINSHILQKKLGE